MKPTDYFEWVIEFGRLFFVFALDIDGLLDSGGWVLRRGDFDSTDCHATLSLASQIQKTIPLTVCFTVLKVFFAKTLLKPRFRKQHNQDLEQNHLAPSLMAYRSTSQPLDFIGDFNDNYLLILWPRHFSIFSSQERWYSLMFLKNCNISFFSLGFSTSKYICIDFQWSFSIVNSFIS